LIKSHPTSVVYEYCNADTQEKCLLLLTIKPTPRPMLYLFRSKLNCYTAQNAITASILLVDFDHGVYLAASAIFAPLFQPILCFERGKINATHEELPYRL
jgi:hypothetical protein